MAFIKVTPIYSSVFFITYLYIFLLSYYLTFLLFYFFTFLLFYFLTFLLIFYFVFRVLLFDVPSSDFRGKPFEARYKHILANINNAHPFAVSFSFLQCLHLLFFLFSLIFYFFFDHFNVVVARIKLRSARQLRVLVKEIIDKEGEGVILRQAESLYLPGRNSALIKLKVFLPSFTFSYFS